MKSLFGKQTREEKHRLCFDWPVSNHMFLRRVLSLALMVMLAINSIPFTRVQEALAGETPETASYEDHSESVSGNLEAFVPEVGQFNLHDLEDPAEPREEQTIILGDIASEPFAPEAAVETEPVYYYQLGDDPVLLSEILTEVNCPLEPDQIEAVDVADPEKETLVQIEKTEVGYIIAARETFETVDLSVTANDNRIIIVLTDEVGMISSAAPEESGTEEHTDIPTNPDADASGETNDDTTDETDEEAPGETNGVTTDKTDEGVPGENDGVTTDETDEGAPGENDGVTSDETNANASGEAEGVTSSETDEDAPGEAVENKSDEPDVNTSDVTSDESDENVSVETNADVPGEVGETTEMIGQDDGSAKESTENANIEAGTEPAEASPSEEENAPGEASAAEVIPYPAQTFIGNVDSVSVLANAPEGALPEGAEMRLMSVTDADTLSKIRQAVEGDFLEVREIYAADVGFWVQDEEIEPLMSVDVLMSVDRIGEDEEAVVVHVDDDGGIAVVGQAQEDGPAAELPAREADVPDDGKQITLEVEAETFSVYAVVVTHKIERRSIEAEGDSWRIIVGYGADAGISTGAELSVREITEADNYIQATKDLLPETQKIVSTRYFDIRILEDGEEVTPFAPVEVRALTAKSDGEASVIRFGDSEPEVMDAFVEEGTEVVFSTDSLSVFGIVYVVDFETLTFDWRMPGGSSILLSALLDALETGVAVTDVETLAFSAPSAMEIAYDEAEGDWLLTNTAAFDTVETLTLELSDYTTVEIHISRIPYPAQVFTASAGAITVSADAPEGAFPEGTEMRVKPVYMRSTLSDIEEAVTEDFV